MSRLIDADALDIVYEDGNDTLVRNLDDMPTIDAVEVVRCKECKYKPHWDEKTESAVFPIPDRCPCECDDYFYSWVPNDDWFCKDGKRKEEDDGAQY